jgi:RHS repeat-associated protein
MTADPQGRRFTYDAENKQTEVRDQYNTVIGQYAHDGDGRRVKKYVPSTGETTIFVYDASNRLVAEYSTIVEPATTAKTSYLTIDHLGSPRILTDQLGHVISRHDYHPFGEEIARTGYGSDALRQKFTGYERDNESERDFAKNRYYASSHGRFTSVDPMPIKKRHLLDPRDFNRYVYVANNPLKYIDPDGQEKIVIIARAYIPAPTVTAPPVVGATFKGDYNEKGERVSALTEQRIVIETDSKRPNANKYDYTFSVGKTERISRGEGSLTGPSEEKADGNTLQVDVKRVNDNTVTLNVKGNESNPLLGMYTGNPGITYDFNITIQSDGEDGIVTVTLSGQHDGFLAYEIVVERPESGNKSETVYKHDPNETGDGPASLYGSGEYYPEIKGKEIRPNVRRKE